jgi:hypothetical protein
MAIEKRSIAEIYRSNLELEAEIRKKAELVERIDRDSSVEKLLEIHRGLPALQRKTRAEPSITTVRLTPMRIVRKNLDRCTSPPRSENSFLSKFPG